MTTISQAWLIHQPAQQAQISHALDCAQFLNATLEPLPLEVFLADPVAHLNKQRHLVTLLESSDLGPLLHAAHTHGASVGLLPVHGKSKVRRLFCIPATLKDAMPLALQSQGASLDLLLCNDEAVIWMVTLGEVPFIEMRQIVHQQGAFLESSKAFLSNIPALFQLQPQAVTVTTQKDVQIRTALVGVVVIENDMESLAAHLVDETVSALDSKLSAIFVAPSSVLDYLGFLLTAFFSKTRPVNRLPSSVSYVKSAQMTLEGLAEMDYYIDGRRRRSRTLTLRTVPKAVTVNVGDAYLASHKPVENDKDVMKTRALPQGEERLARLKTHLPLFSAAQETDFKDLLVTLRDYAQPSASFSLMMLLSAMLATLGLFLNNAPVVIGAMLLAPLMGPVVSAAMGILSNDRKLLRDALWVFVIGTGITLSVAALITLLLPYGQITDEIRSRLQPNLLDLGVAIVSGVAAAYAHARENVLKSLPGVAIAVALVPPACIMGIGLGWFDWEVFSGAALLFLANLTGIALAGALTFLCLGFAPVLRVNRSLGFSLLLAALVSVPLYYSFMNTVVYERIAKTVGAGTYEIRGNTVELSDVSVVPSGDKIKVLGQLHSPAPIQAEDIATLRDAISEQLKRPVLLDVSLRLVQ